MASPSLLQTSALTRTIGGADLTQQFAFAAAAPAGSTPILTFAHYPGGAPTGVIDNLGNTYTKAVGISFQGNLAEIWYCSNIISDGVTPLVITATFSASGNYTSGLASVWAGLNGVDKTVSFGTDVAAPSQTLTMGEPNSQADVLAVMVGAVNGGHDDNGLGISSPGWVTLWRENNSNSYEGGQSAYRIVNGIETTSVTQTSTIGSPINAAMATFKVLPDAITLTGQNGDQQNAGSAPAVTQDHGTAGAASTQSNAGATGAISQSLELAGQNASQQNQGGVGVITQTHETAQSDSVQQNQGGDGAVFLAIDLVGDATGQAQSAGTGAIVVSHSVTPEASTQANSAEGGAITLVQSLQASPDSQSNEAQATAITLTITLVSEVDYQGAESADATISQDHQCQADGSTQDNAASSDSIAISQFFDASPDSQANEAPSVSITQDHLMDAAAGDQSNGSSTASILLGVFLVKESQFVAVVPARNYLAQVQPQNYVALVPAGG